MHVDKICFVLVHESKQVVFNTLLFKDGFCERFKAVNLFGTLEKESYFFSIFRKEIGFFPKCHRYLFVFS
jgi:hypothetical protein